MKVDDDSRRAILDGMRSGNSFIALGFTVTAGGSTQTMGGELTVGKSETVLVQVRFRSPAKNANGDSPKVDHIDLIAGDVGSQAARNTPAWTSETNPTTKVDRSFYLRLRGTDLWFYSNPIFVKVL